MFDLYQMMARKSLVNHLAEWTHRPRLLDKTKRIDERACRVVVLLALLVALNLYDLTFTLFAHQIGMLDERNPIADSFLSWGQEHSLIGYKMLMLLVACASLWKTRRSALTLWACWLLILVYTGLGLVWYRWTADFAEAMTIFNTGLPLPITHTVVHAVTAVAKISSAV